MLKMSHFDIEEANIKSQQETNFEYPDIGETV